MLRVRVESKRGQPFGLLGTFFLVGSVGGNIYLLNLVKLHLSFKGRFNSHLCKNKKKKSDFRVFPK